MFITCPISTNEGLQKIVCRPIRMHVGIQSISSNKFIELVFSYVLLSNSNIGIRYILHRA